jgi:hypothetical protein
LFFCSLAQATPIIDQENWPADISANGPWIVTGDWPIFIPQALHAETFVVAHTGTLVELQLIGAGTNPMTLEIRPQLNGHPAYGDAYQTVVLPGFAGAHSTTIVPLHIAVEAGQQLAFVVAGGAGGRLWGNEIYGTIDGYANGRMWQGNNPSYGLDGPGSWYPNGNQGLEEDFYFKTVVDTNDASSVPEPGTLYLALLALAMMGAARLKRGKRYR